MDEPRIRSFIEQDYATVVGAVALACGDRHRAEESVQEALARALPRMRRITHLRSWVIRVALNDARSVFRRRAAERRAYARMSARAGASDAHAADPADGLVDARIADALASLPERQRQIVALHYLLDLDVASIATTLGVQAGTVKTQLHRGRAALRAALEPGDTETPEAGR